MSIESSMTFFIAIFVFGVTPGPGTFAILARALVMGAKRCLSLSLGMVVSDMLYLLLACYGLASLAANWGDAFLVIRLLGAGYLLFLAYNLWRAPVQTPETAVTLANPDGLASFLQGFMISASNPKVILFYLAFLPTFMDLTVLRLTDVVWVSLLQSVALMLALMSVAWGASSARKLFRSPAALQGMNRVASGLMATAAAYLATRA